MGLDERKIVVIYLPITSLRPWADPEGDRGSRPPMKNHKNIGSLSNTGQDPLKNHKATIPGLMLGHHGPASEKPFKWFFTGMPMMACL